MIKPWTTWTTTPIIEWPVISSSPSELSAGQGQTSRTDCHTVQTTSIRQKKISSQTNYQYEHWPLLVQSSTSTFSEPQSKKFKLDINCLNYEDQEPQASSSCTTGDRETIRSETEEKLISVNSRVESSQIFKEAEPLAQLRVARWWRRHKHLHGQSLPASNNPNTMLYHISRTKHCVSFLLEEKRKLQKSCQLHLKDRSDIHAAIASIDDWLGNYKTALDSISVAVDLEPTNYKYRWLKAKLKKQCNVIDTQKVQMELINTIPRTFPTMLEVERVSTMGLEMDEFISHFVVRKQPVILLDVVKDLTTSTWDLDFVGSIAGSVKAAVKSPTPFSVEWAKLEQSQEITVGEFINQVKEGQTSDYLFDWSLPIHCPQLARDLKIPKYFSGNFLLKTSPGSLYHDSWPSLFIAPKGTISNLHVDAFASHFWMALFQGEKRDQNNSLVNQFKVGLLEGRGPHLMFRLPPVPVLCREFPIICTNSLMALIKWTFFAPDDTPLLYPQYVHSMDPVFSVDLSFPEVEHWPLLALTKPRQCVLQPGELLFVPAGSPHYVENLSDSLAISSNYVDQSNYEQACEELRINALIDPRAADLLQQLEHPNFMKTVKGSS